MSGGREADDRKPSRGIAEAIQGPRPVVVALEAPWRIFGTRLAPLNQAWALSAGMDFGHKRGE
jgi:hypothetical protein